MKTLLALTMTFVLFTVSAQREELEWVRGMISIGDKRVAADIGYIMKAREGALLIRYQNKIKTFAPNQITSFAFIDPNEVEGDSVVFESIETKYVDQAQTARSFQRVLQKGDHFSLYTQYLPAKKSFFIAAYGAVGFGSYIQQEKVLFLAKDGIAYQISYSGKFEQVEEGEFQKVQKKDFYSIIGSRKQYIDYFIKKEKLKFQKMEDLCKIVEYLDSIY